MWDPCCFGSCCRPAASVRHNGASTICVGRCSARVVRSAARDFCSDHGFANLHSRPFDEACCRVPLRTLRHKCALAEFEPKLGFEPKSTNKYSCTYQLQSIRTNVPEYHLSTRLLSQTDFAPTFMCIVEIWPAIAKSKLGDAACVF